MKNLLILLSLSFLAFTSERSFGKGGTNKDSGQRTIVCGVPFFDRDKEACEEKYKADYEYRQKNFPGLTRQSCLDNCTGNTSKCESECGGTKYEPMENCYIQCGNTMFGDCYNNCSRRNSLKANHPDSCVVECKSRGQSDQYCSKVECG